MDALAVHREVTAVDLPGFGETPPLAGEVSIATLADALTEFLSDHDLSGVDLVGSSMGARLVLELARRGVGGATVALDPGGFLELRSFARSPSFDKVFHDLVHGRSQEGAPPGSTPGSILIVWGRQDRVTLPSQPNAPPRYFPTPASSGSTIVGHFPYWDRPQATVRAILAATA